MSQEDPWGRAVVRIVLSPSLTSEDLVYAPWQGK
jgi:hypothetical protein